MAVLNSPSLHHSVRQDSRRRKSIPETPERLKDEEGTQNGDKSPRVERTESLEGRSLAPLRRRGGLTIGPCLLGRREKRLGEHPQPARRVQFGLGAVLQHFTPLFEHEDDFDAPGELIAAHLAR